MKTVILPAKIILPNTGMYPISPEDMRLKFPVMLTHYSELDSYLSLLAHFCSIKNSFFFTKKDFLEYGQQSSVPYFFSNHNLDSFNNRIERDFGLIYVQGEMIFLTHQFLAEATRAYEKISLEHIMFDEVSRKTPLERIQPECFLDIKAMILKAKDSKSMGPFDSNDFPNAGRLNHFVQTTERGLFITPRLIHELFIYYPSLGCVSVGLVELPN